MLLALVFRGVAFEFRFKLAISVIAQRWFGWPNTAFLLPLPVASLAAGVYAWHAFGRDGAWQAFAASIALFALSFLGVAVSLWPMIVPGHFTLWEAASPERTQAFLLVGTLVLLPVILTAHKRPTGSLSPDELVDQIATGGSPS